MVNAQLAEPGLVRHNAMNGLIVGEMDGRKSDRLSRLVALGQAGGLEARVSPEIRLEMWRKFLLIGSMGPLSALTRVPLGAIRDSAETWALAEQAMREVVAVARAEGVPLGEDDVQRTSAMMKGAPPALKASLLTDLEQGRRLELEWLSGAVCRIGAAHNIDTPFHRFTVGILKPHAAGAFR
jgi:2-dehydropantoate 2-reductase